MCLLACFTFAAGCAERERDEGRDVCSLEQPLFGGANGPDYLGLSAAAKRAVVSVQLADAHGDMLAACSGVVVADRWVLTAKHCADHGAASGALVSFGERAVCPDAQLGARRVWVHDDLDLIAIELESPVSALEVEVAPLSVSLAAPEHVGVGSLALLAGYGYDDHGTLGRRAFVAEAIATITDVSIEVDGAGSSGACGGDSGGPLLHRDPTTGRALVLGVLSRGSVSCLGRDEYVRLDRARDWLVGLGITAQSAPAPCDAIDAHGRCFGRLAVHCAGDVLEARACTGDEQCAFDTALARYDCVSSLDGPCGDYDQVGRCEDGSANYCEAGTLRVSSCERGVERCVRGRVDGVARCVAN